MFYSRENVDNLTREKAQETGASSWQKYYQLENKIKNNRKNNGIIFYQQIVQLTDTNLFVTVKDSSQLFSGTCNKT